MNQPELIMAVIATILLLIIILMIVLVRKRISKKEKFEQGYKFPEPTKKAEENKLANKPTLVTEPKIEPLPIAKEKEPLSSSEIRSEDMVESKTDKTVILPQKNICKNLPQDSMLRRHYLTNLRVMIESLKPPRPTDSTLSRHYDSIITAEIEQCLYDQGAIERLNSHYEDHKKILAQQSQEPKIIAEPLLKTKITREESAAQHEKSKLPEDSMLRRHTITQLYALVESKMPIRPTDSVLRRHYDTMIKNEVNKLLGCKVV